MKPPKTSKTHEYKPQTLEEYYEMLESMLKKEKHSSKKF
tara:strand:- start:594 stop:710 length:117 start_codon:yes stop_codon:yes gene_type:complete